MKIYISPSNQYTNIYYDKHHTEMQMMELVASFLVKKLSLYDVSIFAQTSALRTQYRMTEANKWGADYYISIHSNAGGGKGCEVFYQSGINKSAEVKQKSINFASKILAEISKITTTNTNAGDRGIKTRRNIYGTDANMELRGCNMPTCLVEVEFHDTLAGCNWIIANVDAIAEALFKAIVSQMGLKLKNEIPEIFYSGHVQDIGTVKTVANGQILGTIGQSKRLEGVWIHTNVGELVYRGHIQEKGWQPLVQDGQLAGTIGIATRLEALEIELKNSPYVLRARGHVQDIGWMDWQVGSKIMIGTTGKSKRLEAVQIEIVKL